MSSKHFRNLFILCVLISIDIIDASKKSEANLARAKEIAARAYALLGKPCDYNLYQKVMPDFWKYLLTDLETPFEVERFQLVYWNVSIEFLHGEQTKDVRGLDTPSSLKETLFNVNRTVQEAYERSICSAPGGLMECTKEGKCDCLNKNLVTTSVNQSNSLVQAMRGDPTTGKPNPKGTQCFVKEGGTCIGKYVTPLSREQKLEFTCIYYARCRDDVQRCDTGTEDDHKRGSATQASPKYGVLVSFVLYIYYLAMNE